MLSPEPAPKPVDVGSYFKMIKIEEMSLHIRHQLTNKTSKKPTFPSASFPGQSQTYLSVWYVQMQAFSDKCASEDVH